MPPLTVCLPCIALCMCCPGFHLAYPSCPRTRALLVLMFPARHSCGNGCYHATLAFPDKPSLQCIRLVLLRWLDCGCWRWLGGRHLLSHPGLWMDLSRTPRGQLPSQLFQCEAEAAALCAALSWAVSLPSYVPLHFCFDCLSAAKAANGEWAIPFNSRGSQRPVHCTARCLHLLLVSLGRCVSYHHVKSHHGEAWNELVDCAAKAAAASGSGLCLGWEPWLQLLASDILPWLAWPLPYRCATGFAGSV